MIRRVTIKNFKRFPEHRFELADSVVLAGPNNSGKSTLLQAIATWKLGLDRWIAQRKGNKKSRAVKRSKDLYLLANLMTREEIHPEVHRKLDRIAAILKPTQGESLP